MSLNVCVLGNSRKEFCKAIAKEGSSDDFTMYNTNYQGKLINLVEPTKYPEKIVALANSLFLSDFVVFIVDELNAETGEQIVMLDMFKKKGCLVTDLDLKQFIKGTALEQWPVLSSEGARRFVLEEFAIPVRTGDPIVIVDHSFEVKGVGSVVLGIVYQGIVKVHDILLCFPGKKELDVKSIQKNDVDVPEAVASDRLGIAMKRLKSEDVPRGSVLAKDLKCVAEMENIIQFSKFAAKDSTVLYALHCLQSVPCMIENNKIIFEKQLALVQGQPIIFADLNKKIRVVGSINP